MRANGRFFPRGAALRRLAAAAAGVFLCLAAGPAEARSGKGDYVGRWSATGALGYAIPNTDEFGDALAWRLGVGYSRNPRFEVGLDAGRFAAAVSQPETDGFPTHDIASGRLEMLPVCLTVQYRAPFPENMATFVLLAGAGYYFIDYTMADAPRGVLSASGAGLPDQVVRDAWGYHAGVGLEYALSGWLSATIEGRYVFLAPQVRGTAKDDHVLDGSLDLNTWLFTGGMKVAF